MTPYGKVHSHRRNSYRALKLDKIVVVDDAIAILPVMHQVVQEALATLTVQFRHHGRQRRDPRDVRQVVVIVTLLWAHHVKVLLSQASLCAFRHLLGFVAQHIRSRGKLPLAVPVS